MLRRLTGAKSHLAFCAWSIRHFFILYFARAEPAHNATSVQGEIKLLAVTTDQTTFVSWTTEFSNDCDLTVISDQVRSRIILSEQNVTKYLFHIICSLCVCFHVRPSEI